MSNRRSAATTEAYLASLPASLVRKLVRHRIAERGPKNPGAPRA